MTDQSGEMAAVRALTLFTAELKLKRLQLLR